MKKLTPRILATAALVSAVGIVLLLPVLTHATGSITTLQTVANLGVNDQTAASSTPTSGTVAGTNDQTLAISTTTANTPQTSASRTLRVNTIPTNGQSTTIGTCLVTYTSTTTSDTFNCGGNSAYISITTHSTVNSLATALASLTSVSDTGHGLLVASTTASTTAFTTAGAETSATAISFTDGTSGAVSSLVSTTGVIPIAEALSVAVGGTVDTGDTFTIGVAGSTTSATYTVLSTDSTLSNIANGITNALKAMTGYSYSGFTVATSTSNVLLTAKTAGTAFNVATSTTNRAQIAQVSNVTIGGTVETGDVYSITIPTKGTVSYTVQSSDLTLTNIASGLSNALQATSSYSGLTFTSATTTNAVVLTGKTGAAFSFTTGTTNVTPVAQVVTFTMPSFTGIATGGITINANTYSSSGPTQAGLATNLSGSMSGDPAVTCTASGSVITCTAKSAGTPFTDSTSFSVVAPVSSSGGVGGGSSGQSSTPTSSVIRTSTNGGVTVVTAGVTSSPITNAISNASKIKSSLQYKSDNASVKILQQILSSDASLNYTGGVTGYFGRLTQDAVEAFQVKHGVVKVGGSGYGVVGPKTKAALIATYGA